MPDTWFTADTHLGHSNSIHLCGRPFRNVRDMDETIIRNWNARVKPKDTVYHLGDFAWKNASQQYLRRLNGAIHLILGNHDKTVKDGFLSIRDIATIEIDGQHIVLCHYPIVPLPIRRVGGRVPWLLAPTWPLSWKSKI